MYFFYLFTLFKDNYGIFVRNGGNHLLKNCDQISAVFSLCIAEGFKITSEHIYFD